ncbi:putative Cell division control protein 24, OB domain 2 [Plasmopara halstedii]
MDLLDAIEKLEQPAKTISERNADFLEHQVLILQQQLRDYWHRKYGDDVTIPRISFYWVLSKLLRLIEEYPDGLTEAIIVTELTKLFERKVVGDTQQPAGTFTKKRKIRDEEDMGNLLTDGEQKALQAQVISYGDHRVTLALDYATDVIAHMYLHQRFRSCINFLNRELKYEPTRKTYPFQDARKVTFTHGKVLERKDVEMARGEYDGNQVKFTLLPTPYLIVQLNEKNPLDRRLLADSMSLNQVDQLICKAHDCLGIQQLMLKVKILDIGAVRPCQTPLYVHRQVILFGEVDQLSIGVRSNMDSKTQGLHLMVLWDDQVDLSRLFNIGDTLAIFHPFVHVCDQHDTEIQYILTDYSSQQHLNYYLEYGSATVLFTSPCQVDANEALTEMTIINASHCEAEQPLSRLEEIRPGWRNFSLYAHVRRVMVSHGIPLLAAFFYAYYDPKTNQSSSTMQVLDHSIVSKYHLVVMLQVYTASSSKHMLSIELTGDTAINALRLLPGQSVFLDGLVAIDIKSESVMRFRHYQSLASTSAASSGTEDYAFTTNAYTSTSSSSVVVLGSEWENIFGKQSFLNNSSKLTIVNTTPGLLNTLLKQSTVLFNASTPPLMIAEMTVTSIGWLVSSRNSKDVKWTIDTSCEKGQATMYSHKSCSRPLEMTTNYQNTSKSIKWNCSFCQEVFYGSKQMQHTFRELVVSLENGRSQMFPIIALCRGDTIENLLGLSSSDYVQLSLEQKRWTLKRVVGQTFRLVLSRCESRYVTISLSSYSTDSHPIESSQWIDIRMDMVKPTNAFAAARRLLSELKT